MIFSTITFDELGLRATVSRRHRIASIARIYDEEVAKALGGSVELLGAMIRSKKGYINWYSWDDNRLPIEVFNCVSTMI